MSNVFLTRRVEEIRSSCKSFEKSKSEIILSSADGLLIHALHNSTVELSTIVTEIRRRVHTQSGGSIDVSREALEARVKELTTPQAKTKGGGRKWSVRTDVLSFYGTF